MYFFSLKLRFFIRGGNAMDFAEAIVALGERALKLKESLHTEEATKTALILPFIKLLGYDIFNPLEVIPEFIADIPGMKGEKVDYAIMHEGNPSIMIECKSCGANLDEVKCNQLHRYFVTQDSIVAILTDGIRYMFFSKDTEGKKMEEEPFMEFNLEEIDPTLLPELRKLCKGRFDLQKTLETVHELKFNRKIKLLLVNNLEEPQENFVIYIMKEFGVRAQQKAIEQFTGYVKRALTEFVDEQVDARLKKALVATSKKDDTDTSVVTSSEGEEQDCRVVTTDEEREGFQIVKAIMSKVVDPDRVYMRDTVSYCGILLDNKNNKPICRLHFNAIKVKYIETFDIEKKGTRHKIERLSDIYKYEDILRATSGYYDKS